MSESNDEIGLLDNFNIKDQVIDEKDYHAKLKSKSFHENPYFKDVFKALKLVK